MLLSQCYVLFKVQGRYGKCTGFFASVCLYSEVESCEWPVLCVYLFYTLDFVQP